jgi:hypothetical protein
LPSEFFSEDSVEEFLLFPSEDSLVKILPSEFFSEDSVEEFLFILSTVSLPD